MASLTATAMPTLGIVKLALDWAPYRNELVALHRIEPDGTRTEILGSPVTLSGSVAIAYDTTAPLDVDLTYQATLINPLVARDDMGRVSASTWGTPDFNVVAGTWTNTGTNADYTVGSGVATHRHTSVALGRHTVLPGTYDDVRVGATIVSPVNALGAGIRTGIVTRYTDQNNHYQLNITHNLAGILNLNIIKRVASSDTVVATITAPFGSSANRQFRVVGQSVGTRHKITAWWATGIDDAVTLEASDSTLTSGAVGVRSILTSGNTNTLPVNITFDAIRVVDLGSYTLTSGTVNVAASPHGWVRDPLNPANSIRLDNCASHTTDCLNGTNMVFFRGFGDAKYRSATGVFDVNNAERPVAVAQTRKAPVTDLMFASMTLEDIRRIRGLFSSGRNLSLYLPAQYGWGLDTYGADMFTAGDLLESRLNRTDMRKPFRRWSAEIVPADLDDDLPRFTVGGNGIPIPGATFGDMKATGKTFGQLKATGNTFLDFAQGIYD